MTKQTAIIVLSESALPVARKIAEATNGVIHAQKKRVSGAELTPIDDLRAHVQALFLDGTPIVAVMASGALIRLLAPVLSDKMNEPAVLAVSENGASIVPLLGGHHGANDLAREIADALNGFAAVTTAGDVKFGVALDNPPDGFVLANPEAAKEVMASLVAGATVKLEGQAEWLTASALSFADDGAVSIVVTDQTYAPSANQLVYHPKNIVIGVGCERGCPAEDLQELVLEQLSKANLSQHSIACIASIDVKSDEAAVHALANHFNVPARFFDAASLEAETARLQNPSDVVFAEVGCHGVSEGAALASVGGDGDLIAPKAKTKKSTCAIARAAKPMTALAGRARGTVYVVGIGPGSEAWRSPEVSRMVLKSTDLVGYSLYLDLLGPLANGKQRHDFDLGKEEDRVRHAMELAGEGKDVALVCSGDAGIYAMATLIYELFDKGGITDAAQRIEVICSPGISALQGAAARSGAPLGHDFCTISLSDLLTPWADIQRRVRAAGEGDFVIAFYNPVSKKRRTQLAWARDELLNHRPATSPVILATNLGRDGEKVRIVPLGELNVDDVDMLTVVIVGSSDSRVVTTGDGKSWVYTPRGYSGKDTTQMESTR
ncbi:precorrin-3B C(17)-methyltransferase [Ahrensia sp. 13_GOM-1096m]|uniref:precorrin-3B C(17)-methyltransferase n=1 Tax=Ahrensia sp. 13_GOM-1096m TaxID=1380380 RepID=UPI0004795E73|nr:precorrin-3B C(17)-methyltransferase [Ahrensia sp. 13_GOM-1096m]